MSTRETFFISREAVKIFAETAGDPNPIHQDDDVARQMGLTGAIAHGMFVYSYLLQRLEHWIAEQARTTGKRWVLASARCRFHDPAPVGQTFESVIEPGAETEEGCKVTATFQSEGGKKLTQVVAQLKHG